MSRQRQCRYQVQCPLCQEYFAWSHICPKKEHDKELLRGSGEDRMKLIGWVKSEEELAKLAK